MCYTQRHISLFFINSVESCLANSSSPPRILPILEKLKKVSFIMCEGFGNMSRLHLGFHLYFPHLSEITIDHCSNLEELPVTVCNMPSLQWLSITNFHDLLKLLDDIRNLSSLQMLRLYACLSLEKLPYSICNLQQLQFLDISLCGCIKQLPDELGRLSSLK